MTFSMLCLILADDYLFLHGRKCLTEILQSKVQGRINAAEQKGACWRQRQAEKMTVLCAALSSDQ
ncbi:hypothetical protein FACS1894170_05670 [Planctomycetales bacterium]|nr:hypothetical protein FACS1894170_05670 [Planctomycetales bacterium]